MKTLNDINCVHCNDKCDGFKCDAYTMHHSHAVSADALKEEAIKWIINMGGIPQIDDDETIRWIMKFFNITEEELK